MVKIKISYIEPQEKDVLIQILKSKFKLEKPSKEYQRGSNKELYIVGKLK